MVGERIPELIVFLHRVLHNEVYYDEIEDKLSEGYGAEDHFGLRGLVEGGGFQYLEESIDFNDPRGLADGYVKHVPASDCDGVDTCWRTYVKELGNYIIALMFTDRFYKVMNKVVTVEFSVTVYILRK